VVIIDWKEMRMRGAGLSAVLFSLLVGVACTQAPKESARDYSAEVAGLADEAWE